MVLLSYRGELLADSHAGGSQLAESGLVSHHHHIVVELEDGGGALGGDGAAESGVQRIGLALAAGDQQHAAGGHDAAHAHGQSLTGHLVGGGEEAGVGIDGALSQIDLMSLQREVVGGLVKADVAVVTDTEDLDIRVDLTRAVITATPALEGKVLCEGKEYPLIGGKAVIAPENPHLWSPEDPYLYNFTIETETDRVQSYFALRTIESKVVNGIPRLCLNGEPYFFHGLLDQGYWPDGIFTPAKPECYARDILEMKKLGFNTLRKHIKVEAEEFYYQCDKLGMVVFQDMVNNGDYQFFRDTALPTVGLQCVPDKRMHKDPETRRFFRLAMEATVRQLENHPSILYWTIFNEGWGQFDSSALYDHLHQLDDTRWIDSTSGWFRGGKTDVESIHCYFKKYRFKKNAKPVVLSEFGGYSHGVKGHAFNTEKSYGYGSCLDLDALGERIVNLYRQQIINFGYGIYKIAAGVIIGSAWIGADGIYNFFQALIQLFQILRRRKPGTLIQQWKSYGFCGVLILLMHLTLIGLVFQMVNWNRVEESGEIMIIATAAFAFYKITTSFVSIAKDRKHVRPIDSSVRMLELSQAIFSMFSLQAGLLHTFGTGESWEGMLNLATGSMVCLLVAAMGVYMICRGNREIKTLQETENG